jgi:hypothetical protein
VIYLAVQNKVKILSYIFTVVYPIRNGWSYSSWITTTYRAISAYHQLTLWFIIPLMAMWTRYNIMWYSLSMTWGSSVGFSINKTDRHHIDEILLKVGLNPVFYLGSMSCCSSLTTQWPKEKGQKDKQRSTKQYT